MVNLGKFIFLITFFAYMVQGLIFFGDKADELMAIPFALILGGAAAFYLSRNTSDEDAEFQTGIFLWAYSIRLWMSIIFYGWDLTEAFGDEDASGYVEAGRFAENWYNNGFDGFVSDIVRVLFEQQNIGQGLIWAFPTFIAGGESRLIVSVFNCLAGALLVIIVFRITRMIFDSNTAKIAAVLITFWASHIFFSAWTSKEILVILCEWTVLYFLIRNPGSIRVKDGLLAIPFMLSIFIMRFYAAYMIFAAFIFRALTVSGKNLARNAIFGSMVIGAMMIVLIAGGAVNRDFERIERQQAVVDQWREAVAEQTGSGLTVYSDQQNVTLALPIATIYFFFAPFPWEMFSGSFRSAFGAAENILIIAILLVGFPAFRIFFKDKFFELLPIFIFCVLYAGMHIWGLSNAGLAWRHKQTVMPMFFMLVAVGITQRKAGWQLITGTFGKKKQPEINRALNR